jgi:hypothetical protein
MSEPGKVRRFFEAIHSLLLLGLGATFFLFETVEKIWHDNDWGRPTLILLNMVAALCVVLGLERFTTISLFRENIANLHETVKELGRKREEQLGLLERRVAEVLGIRLINGKSNVYSDAARLACTANHFIRTILWIPTTTPPAPAPPEFAEAIADHLRRNHGVDYEVFQFVDVSKIDNRFWHGNRERLGIYKAQGAGVAGRVHLHIVDTAQPLGFDVLLVDNKHVTFAFAPTPGSSEREIAIHFENQPEIAQQIERWMRKITHGSVPFEKFLTGAR